MKLFVRILAAVAIAALTVGPVSAATVSSDAPIVAQVAGTGTITGTLTDSSGAPVANAAVRVTGPSNYATTSDAKGAFSVSSVKPGLYSVSITKAGYEPTVIDDLAVVPGAASTVNATMVAQTFTRLTEVAHVTAHAGTTFNTSTASQSVVSAQTFQDQGTPQVTRVLNEIPGVQISLPSSSGNGAVPGAITFPNIRGGLSYETASLIDGHPLSVGLYGDYVTTFLNNFMLQSAEVVKGPGAMSPQTNYAIGGTVNFRTKDPTRNPTPDYTFGLDNHGGTYSNFGFSDTVGKLGFVFDIASINSKSAVNGTQVWFNPTASGATCTTPGGLCSVNYVSNWSAPKSSYIPGTASLITNMYPLVACCVGAYGDYNNISELVKLRYAFSGATVATVSYLGSQTTADQNGNTGSLIPGTFVPNGSYSSTDFAAGSNFLMWSGFPGSPEVETNNEPIFQAEVRTTLGNDTLLARAYNADIERIIATSNGADQAYAINAKLYGSGVDGSGHKVVYTGQTVPIYYYNYYNQNELDTLTGYSLEWVHPFGPNNTMTASWNNTKSLTTVGTVSSDDAYSAGPVLSGQAYWSAGSIPKGTGQIFNTYMLRDQANFGDKLNAVLSLYENTYLSNFPNKAAPLQAGYSTGPGYASGSNPSPYQTNWTFGSSLTRHFDERIGLTYRKDQNTVLRFAAGSGIAPPYISLLSAYSGGVSAVSGTPYYVQTQQATNLQPETSFGYDVGIDHRLKDGVTSISADAYMTNLFNAFIKQTYDSGIVCDTTYSATCTNPGELYFTQNVNLSNVRYEGLEVQLHRSAQTGFGYNLAGGLQKAYAYNLRPCFYSSIAGNCDIYNTNLAIVADQNNSGNALGPSGLLNGFSNQSIPYLNANAEVSYRFDGGAYASLGGTVYGKNNSYFEKPFTIAYLTVRVPVSDSISLQVSGDNIFNSLSGLFPIQGGGVPIPLAHVPTGAPAGTPAIGASYGNVLGPATWRFAIVKTFGAGSGRSTNGRSSNSSR